MSRTVVLMICASISASAAFAQSTQVLLPEGPGKATVENACAACHALTNITNAGHSRAERTRRAERTHCANEPIAPPP